MKWYGFHTEKGFVHFNEKEWAEKGREDEIEKPDPFWAILDLTGATRLED